jgi:hypothetical protein
MQAYLPCQRRLKFAYLLPQGNQFQLLAAFSHSSLLHHTLPYSLKLVPLSSSSTLSPRMSSQSAKYRRNKCHIIELVKSEKLGRVTAHRWEFHLLDEEKSCRISTCPEFGTVADNYSTYKAHVDAHQQDKYKGLLLLCPVEDCPMRESKVNFQTSPQLKLHQWDCHLPIEKKSCQIADCSQLASTKATRGSFELTGEHISREQSWSEKENQKEEVTIVQKTNVAMVL